MSEGSAPPTKTPRRRLRPPKLSPKGRQTFGVWLADAFKYAAGAVGVTLVLPALLTDRLLIGGRFLIGAAVFLTLAAAAVLVHYMTAERAHEAAAGEEKADG